MKLALRYFLALLPSIVSVGGWQLAVFLHSTSGCSGSIKGLVGCTVGGTDVTSVVAVGLFWFQLLSWVAAGE